MRKDFLGFMLNARDDADLGLHDELIRDQVITFLVAGKLIMSCRALHHMT